MLNPPAPAPPKDIAAGAPRRPSSHATPRNRLTAAHHTEYALFLDPSFDATSFAHAIVNNEPYPPPTATTSTSPGEPQQVVMPKSLGGGSGGEAMLNFGVEDLNRQLKAEVRCVLCCCSGAGS